MNWLIPFEKLTPWTNLTLLTWYLGLIVIVLFLTDFICIYKGTSKKHMIILMIIMVSVYWGFSWLFAGNPTNIFSGLEIWLNSSINN
jgi:hypothetical protein